MTAGMPLAAGGMAWLAHLTPSAGYARHVLPAVMILGVGMGSTIAPVVFTATYDLPTRRHRCRLADGQHDAAGRRRGRRLGTDHNFRRRRQLLPTRPRSQPGGDGGPPLCTAPTDGVHRVNTRARAKPRVNPSEPATRDDRQRDHGATRRPPSGGRAGDRGGESACSLPDREVTVALRCGRGSSCGRRQPYDEGLPPRASVPVLGGRWCHRRGCCLVLSVQVIPDQRC